MIRTNSLRQINLISFSKETRIRTRSLPNIEIISAPKSTVELKRQNSRRGKIFQKTWDRVKTIIHPTRRNSRPNPYTDLDLQRTTSPLPIPPRQTKKQQLSPSLSPSTPNKKLTFDFETATPNSKAQFEDEDKVVMNYEKLQKRLSDELQKSMKDERRKEEALTDDFKKRLQQWDMWKASTGKHHYTEDELQKFIPSDFCKKLQEWEDIKTKPKEIQSDAAVAVTQAGKKSQRKRKSTDEISRQKELAWLDKQLEKIELEKKRLEREMKKNHEREARLEKLKQALRNNPGPKQDMWIKTPTAECKVEGIDEKFAKKLFKWEEKQGIEVESSTMALLNPRYCIPTPDAQFNEQNNQTSVRDEGYRPKRDYLTSDESEADGDYEEALTDSCATKDEGASGASNTDSECFHLKPGFRRRSSDALSTSISASARSPSISGCTSDDEDNLILKTVDENEEIVDNIMKPIVKTELVLVGNDNIEDEEVPSSIIVQTKRTIFTPVVADKNTSSLCDNKVVLIENIESSDFIKKISSPPNFSYKTKVPEPGWKRTSPPRVVGVVRKGNSYDIPIQNFAAQRESQHHTDIRPKFPKMGGKIPAWCSPLMIRRKYQIQDNYDSKFTPSTDFTIDKFLQQTNLISATKKGQSDIQSTSSALGVLERKYVTDERLPSNMGRNEHVRLVSLKRSSSFQGCTTDVTQLSHLALSPECQPVTPQLSIVTKSKSTGSVLGNAGVSKGLLGLASRFREFRLKTDQKGRTFPVWLSRNSSSTHIQQYFKK